MYSAICPKHPEKISIKMTIEKKKNTIAFVTLFFKIKNLFNSLC